MTKPIVYDLWADRDAVLRRIKQRPKYMWFKTPQGNVRMLRPHLDYGIIRGHIEVAPRYVGRVSNV